MREAPAKTVASGVESAPSGGLLMEKVREVIKKQRIFVLTPVQGSLGQSQKAAAMILM